MKEGEKSVGDETENSLQEQSEDSTEESVIKIYFSAGSSNQTAEGEKTMRRLQPPLGHFPLT